MMKLNRLVSTSGMDHATWLEYRKKGIGGSDAGSICGLNPYATAISVYQDKTQEEVTEKADNESMRQGRDLEEYVARRFMEETGKKVRRANSIFYMEENPFMLANVDRLIVGENTDLEAILKVSGNVEAKTTANYGDDGVTQKTTIKQGIASKADVLVPNPVTLIPYRTFLEVKQPESEFVFRIKDAGGAPVFKIVEAEGGLWKNVAMKEIRDYFVRNLESEEDLYKRFTIIA